MGCMLQAIAFVSSGMYGPPSELGLFAPLLVAQLTFSGALVLLLDEALQKGWGLGSGMSLFIAVNICETIAWKAMSPATIMTPHGSAFEGAIPSFFHQLLASDRRLTAIPEAFYRPYGANLTN